jgi:hypothetical protein
MSKWLLLEPMNPLKLSFITKESPLPIDWMDVLFCDIILLLFKYISFYRGNWGGEFILLICIESTIGNASTCSIILLFIAYWCIFICSKFTPEFNLISVITPLAFFCGPGFENIIFLSLFFSCYFPPIGTVPTLISYWLFKLFSLFFNYSIILLV